MQSIHGFDPLNGRNGITQVILLPNKKYKPSYRAGDACFKENLMTKIGILREGKVPVDKRVPFSPAQVAFISKNFKGVQIVVQPSEFRCFSNAEYEKEGVKMQEDLSDCDILMGIKEVPPANMLPGKKY